LEGNGHIRVLDLLFVGQDVEAGELVALKYEGDELGGLVGALLGFAFQAEPSGRVVVVDTPPGQEAIGLTREHLQDLIAGTPSDLAIAVLLIEHLWARDLKQSLRRVAAVPLVEGFLSSDMLADVALELLETARTLDEVENQEHAPAPAGTPGRETTPGGLQMAMRAGSRMQARQTYRTVNRMARRRALFGDATMANARAPSPSGGDADGARPE
jgi:hypothetical protein